MADDDKKPIRVTAFPVNVNVLGRAPDPPTIEEVLKSAPTVEEVLARPFVYVAWLKKAHEALNA